MVSNAMREVASPGPALSRTIARPKLVPVLPLAAADFGVSRRGIQQAITLYLFGIAGGQLLYGPVSDRFGRRPTLIAGLVLYITAGAVAGWAATIGTLLIARVLQVVGGCGGLVCWVALLPVRHSLPICTSPRYRWRSQQPAAKMAHARDLTAAASSASRTSPRRQPCGHA
ncbi:MAG: MFS transporter, partial [Stellaceae bacterium]